MDFEMGLSIGQLALVLCYTSANLQSFKTPETPQSTPSTDIATSCANIAAFRLSHN